ncbi:Hypothetical predicted protein [Prunus dulcis]|uniref:Uncharacterized protein n=1 Tax=Prunus dulcis TaxID=3755 RepID=A0A5E4GF40_PRUDU|nr:Hypothetical predicted protein [Prunus dulcis]
MEKPTGGSAIRPTLSNPRVGRETDPQQMRELGICDLNIACGDGDGDEGKANPTPIHHITIPSDIEKVKILNTDKSYPETKPQSRVQGSKRPGFDFLYELLHFLLSQHGRKKVRR